MIRILCGFQRMIPQNNRPMLVSIGNDIEESMNRYFRGQALVAGLVGILFSIGFLIVGLPLAIVLGLFIGVLNMVPYLQLIGIIPTNPVMFLFRHPIPELISGCCSVLAYWSLS